MRIHRRSLLFAVAMLAAAPGLVLAADSYPSKPIRVIVPFAPGGASDFVARILAPRLQAELGQTIVIDNRAGAAGNIGLELAAAAAPDGYTAFLGNVGTLAINPAIFGKQQRVTAADLAPVSLVANAPDIMVANPSVPGKTVAEFIEHARKTPGMSFASPGSGSLNRLEMELFRQEARLDMTHVPYKGGAGPAITDVVGGHVPVMFVPVPAAMQLIKAGKLKPVAVASAQRISSLPEVPTLVESGFPQVVGGSWQALMFPKETPPAVINRWHAALVKVLAREDVKADLLKGGVEAVSSASPKDLGEFIQEEAKRWGNVARLSNATAD
jgi:tripartite-type tricarboxylate transporter receptor subunit TctC